MIALKPSKKLGQCFLQDESAAEQIAEAIDLENKSVLEIGAGTGQLTVFLAARAKKVTAIEVDSKLVPELRDSLSSFTNAAIVRADALDVDFNGYDALFGNLPYNISTPLLLKILESDAPAAVLLLQKEFAERMAAPAGSKEYSRLSVLAQNNARIELIAEVPASCFSPQPRVNSAIVLLVKKPVRERKKLDEQLVSALFQHKNQTVRNAVTHSAHFLGLSKLKAKKLAEKLSLKDLRVRDLGVEQLARLGAEFKALAHR
ncbi:MAG: 16S rRNA (adenine(1518)-N(6)/adenine(1519)-N(6))-dimethyltransferase RsmA [Candidatus Micrarchaeota archaeon]